MHYDQIGSVRVVADAHGNVIKEVLYDPFGGIIEDTNPGLCVPIALRAACMTAIWDSSASAGGITIRSPAVGPHLIPLGTRAAIRIGMAIVWMIR
jgi:hypothetical protein